MANSYLAVANPTATELSGQTVRGIVENSPSDSISASTQLSSELQETIRLAAEQIMQGVEKAGHAMGETAKGVATHVTQGASTISPEQVSTLGQTGFSWGGYTQAVGVLFLLLAVLWLLVWLVRRYGRFNFMPRPGAFPRDALAMEAQMPLGPRKGLMVVRFLNRRLLLGVTDRHITLLTEENIHHEPHDTDFQSVMAEMQSAETKRCSTKPDSVT